MFIHDAVNHRFGEHLAVMNAMIILCKSCRCLTLKNLVIISRNLALTELQFLLLIGPNSKIFLSLQRTPRGTEGLRTVTGIFCFFKNVYIYINVFTAAIPVQKNNNLFSQV